MPAGEADWETEYLAADLAVRVVGGVDEAIGHVNRYGTKHSEAIVAEDEAAVEAFLARVDAAAVFVPAGNPVFKKDRPVTPAAERLEMCRIATRSNPAFDVSAIEIERGGDTYTVDTLRQLRAHYPDNVELRFITGADAVYHIVQWRESAAIADLARLIAVTRPGYALSEERRAFIAEHGNFAIDYLEVTALAISSSDLRRRVAAGKSIRYLTMQGVLDYIQERGLYRADPHHEGGVR